MKAPRKAPPFRLTMPEVPESSILPAVLTYLQYHRDVAWAMRMNTGAAKFKKKDGTEQFVRFGFDGLSDIIGQMRDGRFLAIETKRRLGKANEDQKLFLTTVQRYGGIAGIARSIDDAQAILRGLVYVPAPPPAKRAKK